VIPNAHLAGDQPDRYATGSMINSSSEDHPDRDHSDSPRTLLFKHEEDHEAKSRLIIHEIMRMRQAEGQGRNLA